MLALLLRTPNEVSLLLVRVGLGVVILPHGLQKLVGWFGAVALILGLFGRVAAFEFHILAIAMALAVLWRGSGAFSIDRMLETRRGPSA